MLFFAQRRKRAAFYLYGKVWVRVLGPCLLLLHSA